MADETKKDKTLEITKEATEVIDSPATDSPVVEQPQEIEEEKKETKPVGDGFPVFKLKEKYENIANFTVTVGSQRKVGRSGNVVIKNMNVTYDKADLLINTLSIIGKHPILRTYFQPITDDEAELIFGTPSHQLASIQRKRSRLA